MSGADRPVTLSGVEATQTALIVAVPETEFAVGPYRARYDRAAGWGVPAHVTVLYPFLPPERIDDDVLASLRAAVATVPRFATSFDDVRWFGDTVVWLAPRPDLPFRRLTAAVHERFPHIPPYEGEFGDDPVPHLTIAHNAPRTVLADAAEAVAAHLPIRATVEVVRLIAGSTEPNSWRTLDELPLGWPS
jgi:2'-5' RNA ligase